MAVTKQANASTLSIEVASGIDSQGATVYRKKNFANLRPAVDAQNVYDVAEALKTVLEAATRDYYVTDGSKLINS